MRKHPYDALIIVDMQPPFYNDDPNGGNAKLVVAINKQIEKFTTLGKYIFVVEYDGRGDTDGRLKLPGRGKDPKVIYLVKERDNGADDIHKYILDKKLDCQSFLLMGINTCACIKSTYKGLIEYRDCGFDYEVTVGRTYCNCSAWAVHDNGSICRNRVLSH